MVSKHDFICIYPVWGLLGWFLLFFLGWFFKIIFEKLGFCIFVAVLCLLVSYSSWPHGLWPARLPVHGIFQASILEWVAISYSRGSSWLRDWTGVSCGSCIWQSDSFTPEPPGKPLYLCYFYSLLSPLSSTMLVVLVIYYISLVLLFTLFSLWVSGCFPSTCFLSLFSLDVSSLILKLLQISYFLSSRN